MSDQTAPASQPERRASARFIHASAASGIHSRLPAQFDLYVSRTDLLYPAQGPLPARVSLPCAVPPATRTTQELIRDFKETMRGNPVPDQVVHVTKPYMDQRSLRIVPMVLGRAKVLGLDRDRPDERSIFIRKPPKMNPDTGDPDALGGGDVIVLGFSVTSTSGAPPRYVEMVAEVLRVALEHLVLRPRYIRQEEGRRVELIDFSAGGVKVAADDALMAFLSEGADAPLSPDDPLAPVRYAGLRLTFYIVRSSVYGLDMYRTDLPMKASLLGQIVRADLVASEQGLKVQSLGLKFTYDPSEFSIKTHAYEKWTRIREVYQSQHFSDVHSALSGRKKSTLPDPELFERAKKLFERSKLRRRANARWLIRTTLGLADQKRTEIESGRMPPGESPPLGSQPSPTP